MTQKHFNIYPDILHVTGFYLHIYRLRRFTGDLESVRENVLRGRKSSNIFRPNKVAGKLRKPVYNWMVKPR